MKLRLYLFLGRHVVVYRRSFVEGIKDDAVCYGVERRLRARLFGIPFPILIALDAGIMTNRYREKVAA